MAFQLFGTNHLRGPATMYVPTDEDVATCRNAAELLTGFQRSELGHELHQLAHRLERGRNEIAASRRAAAGMAAEQRRLAEADARPARYGPDLGDDPDGDASIDPRDT